MKGDDQKFERTRRIDILHVSRRKSYYSFADWKHIPKFPIKIIISFFARKRIRELLVCES